MLIAAASSHNLSQEMSDETPAIWYCHCAYRDAFPAGKRLEILAALQAAGVAFQAVPDLCEWAARKDDRLKQLAQLPRLTIVACYPRAVLGLLCAGDVLLDERKVTVLNPLAQTAAEIVGQLLEGSAASKPVELPALEKGNGWVPWFPVIDYGRCVNCRQCLSFCLFGVYAASPEGRVEVRNPHHCKTYCPACARICPEIAIMFPKHAEGPINGAPIVQEEIERAKVKVNVEQLLGSDPYGALTDRRKRARLLLLKKQSETALVTPPSRSPGLVDLQFKKPE